MRTVKEGEVVMNEPTTVDHLIDQVIEGSDPADVVADYRRPLIHEKSRGIGRALATGAAGAGLGLAAGVAKARHAGKMTRQAIKASQADLALMRKHGMPTQGAAARMSGIAQRLQAKMGKQTLRKGMKGAAIGAGLAAGTYGAGKLYKKLKGRKKKAKGA